jgi:predicted MPP superfamily phosphohydrolase
MKLDQGLEDLRMRLLLMQGQATFVLFLAPTEAATDENRRILAEVLRIGGANVVDLGRIGHESGPANWVEITQRQPGDAFLLSAIPASVFGASAFASLVNAEREFLRKLPGPVLLVISRDTEDILRKRAPDFLTWAATTYDLPEPSEFLALARRLGAVPTSSQRHIQQEKPFRFLHLSDFHLRPSRVQRFDQDRVLRGLVDFLTRDHERFPLDGVFITGDLGFSGKPAEYEIVVDLIKKLLAVTKVAPERTFVVPGNHDADRSVGEWLLRTLPNPEMADRFFLEERARDAHTRKFTAYHEAMASVLGSSRKLGLGVGHDAIEMIDWDDARIAVASFNSAWFAQADSDRGKLWLGEANIAEAGDRLAEESATFSLALMHHPAEYFDEQERDIVEDRLERTFDVVVRGHLHKNRTRVIKSQRGGYVEVAGQAAYQSSQWPNGCYLGEIRPCARTVTLFPYRYGKAADPWAVDPSVFPDDAANGYAHTFEVPEKRIAPAAIRRAREKAAVEVVRAMSPNMKQQMAQELGWHDSARKELPPEVEQRIERKAAAANEDEALWAKPEQAKKLEKAVQEAISMAAEIETRTANATKLVKAVQEANSMAAEIETRTANATKLVKAVQEAIAPETHVNANNKMKAP